MSPLTASTVLRVQQRSRTLNPAIRYALHDNTSPAYRWLLPGWLAEERTVANGRVYRVETDDRTIEIVVQYYYDPSGRLYRTKNEVLLAWELAGIIVLDL
ncbi:hypothetical protein PVL29_016632 [Vitis rotundifolia]|uniref:Uncharacterized protein n=1 Tax=Vitis rotundifolia TaxID=103349 RepID=A0AA38Z8A1_VITRO|nr:hypothetical protein PVL29_016632 [Vitis rotundifolia]